MKGNQFTRDEISSIYVDPGNRFVVSLVVGYGGTEDGGEMTEAKDAAASALELTNDGGSDGTIWFVFDRQTGTLHQFEQSDFAQGED